uniref:Uncharacterized protein n=1 Tax=Romanomermis culicivorax TaxID=13658 RepID=A0A915L5M4_ROMCU
MPDVNKTLIADKIDDLIIANFYVVSMTVMYIHECLLEIFAYFYGADLSLRRAIVPDVTSCQHEKQ